MAQKEITMNKLPKKKVPPPSPQTSENIALALLSMYDSKHFLAVFKWLPCNLFFRESPAPSSNDHHT